MRVEGVIYVACHPLEIYKTPIGCIRLRNDLYCVGWGVKLYSLTHATSLFKHCLVSEQDVGHIRAGWPMLVTSELSLTGVENPSTRLAFIHQI